MEGLRSSNVGTEVDAWLDSGEGASVGKVVFVGSGGGVLVGDASAGCWAAVCVSGTGAGVDDEAQAVRISVNIINRIGRCAIGLFSTLRAFLTSINRIFHLS